MIDRKQRKMGGGQEQCHDHDGLSVFTEYGIQFVRAVGCSWHTTPV